MYEFARVKVRAWSYCRYFKPEMQHCFLMLVHKILIGLQLNNIRLLPCEYLNPLTILYIKSTSSALFLCLWLNLATNYF